MNNGLEEALLTREIKTTCIQVKIKMFIVLCCTHVFFIARLRREQNQNDRPYKGRRMLANFFPKCSVLNGTAIVFVEFSTRKQQQETR